MWERSLSHALPESTAREVLKSFSTLLKKSSGAASGDIPAVSAHLAPLFGAVSNLLGLSARQASYVFVLAHVKALVSAAVRASGGAKQVVEGPVHGGTSRLVRDGDGVEMGGGEDVEG